MERVLTDCCRAAGLTSWLTHLQRAAELHGTHVPDVRGAAIARRERGAADGLQTQEVGEHARATGLEAGKQVCK